MTLCVACVPSCTDNQVCVAATPANLCQCFSGAATNYSTAPSTCTTCTPGFFSNVTGQSSCTPCASGTFSNVSGATNCTAWTVCGAGFAIIAAATSSSDRKCANIDACVDYPCSVNSAGCQDLPPPAGNSPQGRVCGACNTNYTRISDLCINDLALPPSGCYCAATYDWVNTACGSSDSKPCTLGAGSVTRLCLAGGVWADPVATTCTNGVCETYHKYEFIFSMTVSFAASNYCSVTPCDHNSLGCALDPSGPAPRRTCGACRRGYELQYGECVDIELNDVSNENFALGTLETYLTNVTSDLQLRVPNQASLVRFLLLFKRLSQARTFDHLDYISLFTNQMQLSNTTVVSNAGFSALVDLIGAVASFDSPQIFAAQENLLDLTSASYISALLFDLAVALSLGTSQQVIGLHVII